MDTGNSSRDAFENARFLSLLNNLKSVITGKENRLLSFDKISKRLDLKNQRYLGIKAVPTEAIVGSVDRYEDFDSQFLPKKDYLEKRWTSIHQAYNKDINLPLVKLYKVGEIYFVIDGHHRVSVARKMGVKYIDSEVIEFSTKFPITREMDPKDMFIQSERENFLQLTGLRESRPDIKIRLTIPGKYDVLLNQINQYMYQLNKNRQKNLNLKQASARWYDDIYIPSIEKIDRTHIIDSFPYRTKSDLFVWIYEHKDHLSQKYGKEIKLSEAVNDFSQKYRRTIYGKIKALFLKIFKKTPT
ncbi:MAG: DUF4032 domain-containing protein [Actinomycetota bacterium]